LYSPRSSSHQALLASQMAPYCLCSALLLTRSHWGLVKSSTLYNGTYSTVSSFSTLWSLICGAYSDVTRAIGLWSNVPHYVGNKVQFGKQIMLCTVLYVQHQYSVVSFTWRWGHIDMWCLDTIACHFQSFHPWNNCKEISPLLPPTSGEGIVNKGYLGSVWRGGRPREMCEMSHTSASWVSGFYA
jgi:hypothetical protein